jgi:hypothetical protein
MTSKTVLLSCFLCVLTSKVLIAQASPDVIINNFFDLYKTVGSDRALDYIFSTNKYVKNSQEAIDELKNALEKAIEIDGPFWGYDLVSKKMAGEHFIMFTFLVRHDRGPLTFRILFYKPHDKWQVQNFKFDSKMDDELEESSKLLRNSEN